MTTSINTANAATIVTTDGNSFGTTDGDPGTGGNQALDTADTYQVTGAVTADTDAAASITIASLLFDASGATTLTVSGANTFTVSGLMDVTDTTAAPVLLVNNANTILSGAQTSTGGEDAANAVVVKIEANKILTLSGSGNLGLMQIQGNNAAEGKVIVSAARQITGTIGANQAIADLQLDATLTANTGAVAVTNLDMNAGSLIGTNASITATGTTSVDGDVSLTSAGAIDLQGAITLNKDITITSGNNTNQTFGSTIRGDSGDDNNLTIVLQGNGEANFDGIVGAGGADNDIGAIDITGKLDLNAAIGTTGVRGAASLAVSGISTLDADVNTSGTQTYSSGVTLGTGARILKAGGTGVTFSSTLAGGTQNLTITGNAVFGGNATGLGALDVTGTLAANATNITATDESITVQGTTTIADGITLVVDSGTADKDITFAAITAGDATGQNLTIDAGTNASAQIFLNGAVTNLDTLAITDAGILNLVGDITVDTLTIPTAVNNVIVSGEITTTADTSFANVGTTVIGNATGDTNTFGGGLDITAGPTSATAITLQGTIATTNDQIDLGDSNTGIRIADVTTISTGAGAAAVINLAGAISGTSQATDDLIINSTGVTNITQAITALDTLVTNAGGTIATTANITTAGVQTYANAVTVDGDITFQGSTVSMGSLAGADGTDDEVTITGIFDLNGAATTNLKTLAVSSTSNIGGDVTTSTTQTYSDAVVMSGADRTLTATTVNFGSTVDGGGNELAIVGILNLDGNLSNTTNFSVSSTSDLGSGGSHSVVTSGTQTYSNNVVLSSNARNTLQGSTVTFLGTLSGAGNNDKLTITGNAVFGNGTADTVTGIEDIIISGNTTIETTTITTVATGNANVQTYGDSGANDTTTLGTNVVMTTGTADADTIIFNSKLDSDGATPRNLTLTGGIVQFAGVVGVTQDLGAIDITGKLNLDANIGNGASAGAASLAVSGISTIDASVTTSGNQTYTSGVTLGTGDITLRGGTINFGSTLAGGTQNLTITGALDLDGAATGLGTLAVSGASNLGASVSSDDTQSYGTSNGDLTTISTDVTLTTTNDNITMRSVDGAAGTEDLTFVAGTGDITVNGDLTDIAILTVTSSGGTTFNGSVDATTVTITDTGDNDDVIFNDTLTATTLTLTNGGADNYDVALNGGGEITNAVTFANGGTVQIGNGSGDSMLFVGGFTATAPSALTFGGSISTTNQAITVGDSDTASTLNSNTTFDAGNAALTIDGDVAGAGNSLTLNTSGTTNITTNATMTGLSSLTVSAGATQIRANITTTGNQVYNGAVTYFGNRTLTGANVQFASTVAASGVDDTLTIAVGNLNLDGAATVESLTVAEEANFDANVTAHTGITVSDKTTIDEGKTITLESGSVTTGNMSLEEVVGTAGGGAETLVLNSNSSTIAVTGAVSDLANLTITQSGGATFSDAVTLSGTLTLTDTTDDADIIFNGAVTAATLTTQNPQYDLTFNAGGTITADTDILSTGVLTIGNDASDTMTFTGGFSSGSTGAMNLAGTLATTNQALDITRNVTLTADSTISAGNGAITTAGTINGNFDLALNSTGVTSIDGVIGGSTALNTLTTNAGGTTSINANISTSSTQTYNDAVDIEGATRTLTSNGGAIFFASTVDSLSTTRRSLTVNAGSGLTTFDGVVGGTDEMGAIIISGSGGLDLDAAVSNATSLAVTGASNLGGDVTTVDAQTYTGAVTLSGATRTLTSSGGAKITFGNTIDGTQALNVNTAGTTVVNGNVGSGTALGAIDIVTGAFDLNANITSAASIDVNSTTALGGNITTLGAQVYSGTITLDDSGSFTLDSTGNDATDDITTAAIAGVNGGDAENLTLDAGPSGDITIGGAVSDITNLTITDSNGADFSSTVTLSGDLTITDSSAGADINFEADISANDLVTTANGYDVFIKENATITAQTTFLNTGTLQIGNGTDDSSTFTGGLVATAASGITLAGTINTTDTTMTLGDGGTGITLGANTTLSSGSGIINIAGATAGAGDNDSLTINTTGTTNITATISGITTLTTNLNGTTAVSANITSSGKQTFNDAVTVNGTLDFTGSEVEFNSTLQGADGTGDDLTISGVLDLNAAATNLTSLDVEGTSDLGANVTTSGTQEYTGASVMSGGAARTLTGSTVLFGSTVDGGAQNLTITGILDLDGALTNTTNFEVTSSSNLGGNVTTTGTQIYTGAVTLSGAARTLTATNSSAVTFSSTINGTQNLTVATGGLTTFDGIVGGGTAVSAIAITGTGGLDLDAAITSAASLAVTGATNLGAGVITSGDQTYTGAVTLSADNTLQSSASGDLLFSSTTDSDSTARALILSTGGNTTFTGAVGGTAALSGLTSSTAAFTAAAIKVGGAISITNSGTGSITGVISDGASAASLTKAGAGTLTLSGTNTYTGNTTVSAGTLAVGGAGSLGSGTYAGTIAIAAGATLTYGSSVDQTLSGVIGTANAAGLVTKSGTSTLTLSADNIFEGDLTVSAGTVVLSGSLDAAINLAEATTFTVTPDITNGSVISATSNDGSVDANSTINMPINLVNNQVLLWADGADNDGDITNINSALTDNILIDYVGRDGGDDTSITGENKTTASISSSISSTNNQATGLLQAYISGVSLTDTDEGAETAFTTAVAAGASALLDLGRQVAPQTDAISGSSKATVSTNRAVEGVISDRLSALRASDGYISGSSGGAGVYAESMFFQILGSTAEQDSKKVGNGTQYGYDVTTTGFAMGTDAANENGDVFGVSFSMSNSDLDGKGTGKSTNDTDTYIASIYGDKILERGFLESVFSLGYSENSTSRLVNTSGLNRSYKGDYDSSHAGFKLGAGTTKEMGVSNDGYKSYITPFVSIAGSYVSTDAYTESSSLAGDNLSLKIEQDDLLSLVGTIGFRAAKETERGTPSFSIAIDNEFGDDAVKSTNKYQGGAGSTFVTSTEMEALSARIGLGYSFGSDLKSFNFDYEAEVNNDDYLGHTGSFSFTSKF